MERHSTANFDMTAVVRNATQQAQQQIESLPPMLRALGGAATALNAMPHLMMDKQLELAKQHMALAASVLDTLNGGKGQPVAAPDKGDRRFAHEGWKQGFFDWIKQSYLINANWARDVVNAAEGMDPKTKHQAVFFTNMLLEAMSPSNFAATNPEVLAALKETKGESLKEGFANWMADMAKGTSVSMTDGSQFELGKNIACTPGKVVMRNDLVELIHYAPAGKQVHKTPVLICPPWINRYYILDLSPHNSVVKYLVDQGFNVFMMSWKNPDASYRDVGFEDYLQDGLLASLDATLAISGENKASMVGYCIGGTLLACGLAYMAAAKQNNVASATFLTTMVDFTNPGDLGVFIDEEQLAKLDRSMEAAGYLDGRDMAGTFSALRSAELYWSFVVNQYLLGKQPTAFDILFWNADSTRMPYAMHSWYLRELYLNNNLARGKVELLGEQIDLANINVPVYMVGAQNDHITPWQSCYTGLMRMGSNDKRFALTKAGHVAGVVNPPTPKGKPVKRSFVVGKATAPLAETWAATSETKEDSWWPDWSAWLAGQCGDMVAAPKSLAGNGYKTLGDAPGTYVKE